MLFHLHLRRASFTGLLVVSVAALTIASAARAALYWDGDADGSPGGNGTWDLTTQNWSTTGTGAPDSLWTPNDGTQDAVFDGGAGYTVTIPGGTTINANSLTLGVTAGNIRITGGTVINITDPNNSIVMNTNVGGSARAQIIESPIGGTDITVVPNAAGTVNSLLTLGANGTGSANTFTGDLIFGGPETATVGLSQVAINHPTALPPTATVRMRRNLSQLLFGAGGASGSAGYSATFDNDIVLNDGGSGTVTQAIGAFAADTVVTLGGEISGDANLIFQLGNGGGQGTIVLANQATYTGFTTVSTGASGLGTVRLGIDDALPVATRLSVNRGRLDLGGFDQQVGGLNSTAAGNGFVTNTGSISTLTIDGDEIGNYAGTIGAAAAGHNDDIALVLAPTNTGRLTLSTGTFFGNTYSGGTTVNGGTLLVANDLNTNPFSSATGSGPVAVNNGGTLGGTGSVGGAVTVAADGHLAPGSATGNTIGTLTAFNALTLNSGSNLDIGLGSPAPGGGASDRVDMPSGFGSFALNVPAAANSIGVNLGDPAGGAAGNGTYTLMTFQQGQYTGNNNASPFFTSSLPNPNSLNGATITYHLADDSNTIQDGNPSAATRVIMNVSGGPNALTWTGAANGNWDTGATANFNNAATNTSTTFAGNDNVTFDDSGANPDVTVAAGGVQPNIVTVANDTVAYTFSGGDIMGSSLGGGGGMFLRGTGSVTFNNNYTAAGPIAINKTDTGSATFNGNITDATSLTVNSGSVALAGANTYTGDNTVNGGTLIAQGASATFGSGDLTVNAGSAGISAGATNAIFDTATLTLAGGGTADTADAGFIGLDAGINEQIGSLVLGETVFTSGTFGATGSGAQNVMDEYFAGLGIITVVGVGGLPGDYNDNGVVDAADYTVWRDNLGSTAPLPNDLIGGAVDQDQYDQWKSNFGNTSAGAGAVAAVPEPAAGLLALIAVVAACVGWGRRVS